MFFWHLVFLICLFWTDNQSPLFAGERGSSAPFISGDTLRAHADHIFDETTLGFVPERVQEGDLIFVKTDWEYLEAFFTQYHPRISHPYILLTHNSDHGAPGPFYKYLEEPKLLAWFAQNVEGESHPKLHPVPIGLANRCWTHGNPHIFSGFLQYRENQNRPYLCYLNFQPQNYPTERFHVWDLFVNQLWCATTKPKPLREYLGDLIHSKFVLSPRGNGLDCHRTWEALLMGAIPIVRTSSLDPLFEDLPVLIIENWEILSESYLRDQYEIIKNKKVNLDKLFADYWVKLIRNSVKK